MSYILRTRRRSVHVAILGEEIVGSFVLYLNAPQGTAFLDYLVIAAPYAGTGLSRRILKKIKAKASRSGCTAISLAVQELNLRGIAFYRRMGFTQTSGAAGSVGLTLQLAPASGKQPVKAWDHREPGFPEKLFWRSIWMFTVELPDWWERWSPRRRAGLSFAGTSR